MLKMIFGMHGTQSLGVCHSDELLYLFKFELPLRITMLLDEQDQNMVDFMVELWTNFAMYHDPTPKDHNWLPYGSKSQSYVRLENSKIIAQPDQARDERLKFWNLLLK